MIPIHLNYNGTNALHITEGRAPFNIDSKNRITRRLLREHRPVVCKPNPISIALKYQKMYQDPAYGTMEKVALQLGVSRVRVHQMLNLLNMDQGIIVYVQNITDITQRNFLNEHRLRTMATLPKSKQFGEFQKLCSLKDDILKPKPTSNCLSPAKREG